MAGGTVWVKEQLVVLSTAFVAKIRNTEKSASLNCKYKFNDEPVE